MSDAHWGEQAVCRNVDPAVFAGQQGRAEKHRWLKAATFCAACPVRSECLEDALRPEDLPTWARGVVSPEGGRRFAMFQAGYTPDQLNDLYLQKESRKAA